MVQTKFCAWMSSKNVWSLAIHAANAAVTIYLITLRWGLRRVGNGLRPSVDG